MKFQPVRIQYCPMDGTPSYSNYWTPIETNSFEKAKDIVKLAFSKLEVLSIIVIKDTETEFEWKVPRARYADDDFYLAEAEEEEVTFDPNYFEDPY